MADIASLLANAAQTNANFDFGLLNKSYWQGQDEAQKNALRDAFKGGVPLTADGQPDFSAMAKTLFQKGGLAEGTAAAGLGQAQQNIQQNREGADFLATGDRGTGVSPSISSSSSRGLVQVAPAAKPQASQGPQGDQPGSIVGLVSSAGIPDELAGPIIAQISASTRTDPNTALDPALTQRVQQVAQAAAQRMRAGQPQQPVGLQPGSTAPMVPTPVPTQTIQGPPGAAQTSPFANAVAAGLIPPGVDPTRYVEGLRFRAAALPKGPAQEVMQSKLNAIDKATELTAGQRDYYAAQANPKLNEFQAQQEADRAQALGTAQANVKEQGAYIDNAKMAGARLGTLNAMQNILNTSKNLDLGFGSEASLKIKMILEKIPGFDVGDLSGAQLIQKFGAALASESTKALATRPTQFEFRTFLANNPGLALDEKGNIRMIGILAQNAKRDYELGKLARQNRDNWENWDSVVEAYDKKNPIKDPTTGKILSNNSVIAPAPQTAQSALPKLEPGKTMFNGHLYKGGNPKDKANWELRS